MTSARSPFGAPGAGALAMTSPTAVRCGAVDALGEVEGEAGPEDEEELVAEGGEELVAEGEDAASEEMTARRVLLS
ncbi:hypothetical protein [Streptomyces sp. NPDC052127]|uniref:hypothetical protein n=1 Tax=Streptomyces sp. NPDC052127 TaxID=3155679 RepID=UPI00343A5996